MFKSGFVTIVGRPNVGKSTLMNKIMGEKLSIVSNKPQTTRNNIQTILTTDDYQIVFVDTPGIHKPKHKLGEYMVNSAKDSLKDVDLVLFLTNPDTEVGCGDKYILEALKDAGCFPRFVSECELTNFESCLEINLDDPRDPSKIVYPLHVIGVIILTARVSGCNNCEEIRTYWEDHLDFFKKRLYDCPDEDYIPSAQTIRRVQTILDIDNLTQVYYEFFSKPAVAEEETKTSTDIQDKEVHAIDGQNLSKSPITPVFIKMSA